MRTAVGMRHAGQLAWFKVRIESIKATCLQRNKNPEIRSSLAATVARETSWLLFAFPIIIIIGPTNSTLLVIL